MIGEKFGLKRSEYYVVVEVLASGFVSFLQQTYLLGSICCLRQVYTEFRLSQFPSLTPLISRYVQGSDQFTSLGPYFQRPGRTVLERYLVDVPEPSDILGDNASLNMKRVYFCGLSDSRICRGFVHLTC